MAVGGRLIGQGIVWPTFGQATLEQVEAPPPGPGDVVVDVTTSVVHVYYHRPPGTFWQ